jgi:hypothetical protein
VITIIFPLKRGLRTTKPYVSVRKILLESNNLEAYEAMSKEELIQELIKARIAEARLKKWLRGEGGWFNNSIQQKEYQVILELSGEFPVKLLCEAMHINRSSFYYWKKRLGNPAAQNPQSNWKHPTLCGIPYEVSFSRLPMAAC